jgi:hypothetical protein
MTVPAGAGVDPVVRCNYEDPANNGESGQFNTVGFDAVEGHGITPPPIKVSIGAIVKAEICHYHGHEAENGRSGEIVAIILRLKFPQPV